MTITQLNYVNCSRDSSSLTPESVVSLYKTVTENLIAKRLSVSTMESCTSGLISSLLTCIEGSSQVLKGAFVTYCNEAKIQQGVPREIIEKYGVYSQQTAYNMANACRKAYDADIGIGITGTASNADTHNSDSVSNVVYAVISTDRYIFAYRFNTPEIRDRFQWKLVVARYLGEQLLKIFTKENVL